MKKRILSLLLALAMALSLAACGGTETTSESAAKQESSVAEPESSAQEEAPEIPEEGTEPDGGPEEQPAVKEPEPSIPLNVAADGSFDMDLSNYMDKWEYVTEAQAGDRGELSYDEDGNPVMTEVEPCYALRNLVYCTNPVEATVQMIDVYVPAAYVDAVDNGDGTYTCTISETGTYTNSDGNSYTGLTAPIIFQNTVDGYAEASRLTLASSRKGHGVGTFEDYILSGYILVSIGSRGIGGTVDGTAPACVVDQKAGLRFLKANTDVLPGDWDKIIVTGASAGGGVAAVVGASGNSALYDPYLEEIGAVMDSTDDVYSVMAFCPITNLDTADAAFEWLHPDEYYSTEVGSTEHLDFSDFQCAVKDALYDKFLEELTGFGMDPQAFYDGFLDEVNESIAYYVDTYEDGDAEGFASKHSGLEYDGSAAVVTDWGSFAEAQMGRKKSVPSFDSIEMGVENGIFNNEHYSSDMLEVLEGLADTYQEAADAVPDYQAQLTDERLEQVALMTPNTFLTGEQECTVAPLWRFRTGLEDGDLGAASSWVMANLLEKNTDSTVDYGLVWGVGHMAADYGYEDVQVYVDSISQ